ncbi:MULTISPECIES: hypothetical protein [unclassified Luteimonas]
MNKPFHSRMPAMATCALALGAMLHAPDSSAATERVQRVSASAVCEAPLPVYDITLRKRPIGIGNEGTTNIFVSCALPTDAAAPPGGATVSVRLAMLANLPATTVNCQLVAGTADNLVFTEGTAVVPSSGTVWLTWDNVHKGSTGGTINFSCSLPPQMDISTILYREVDPGGGL